MGQEVESTGLEPPLSFQAHLLTATQLGGRGYTKSPENAVSHTHTVPTLAVDHSSDGVHDPSVSKDNKVYPHHGSLPSQKKQ